MRRLAPGARLRVRMLILSLAAFAPAPAAAADGDDDAVRVLGMLDKWQIGAARPLVEAIVRERPGDPVAEYLGGYQAFLDGDYARAEVRLERALELAGEHAPASWRTLRSIVSATADVTRSFAELDGEHFTVRFPRGNEEILAPWVLEALEAARQNIGKDLGFLPDEKIRVEIYRETDDLARVSTLTKKEIEASGTIALCKWNRLMITSPAALVRGYGWMDTLAHEYTHFVVTARSRNAVPIWFHEGVAKYFERRWRGPAGGALPPGLEHLLRRAVEKGHLVTFDEMHPSMAKLPTQERASLAFAEVFTAVEFLERSAGPGAITRAIDRMAAGTDDRRAVGQVFGASFGEFERQWKKALAARKAVAHEGPLESLRFRRRGKKDEDDDVGRLGDKAAERHARLGGMLRARGRAPAALLEYRRALTAAPDHPHVAAKLARLELDLGQPAQAIKTIRTALEALPDASSPNLTMGEALVATGALEQARPFFEAALRQNPFDPAVHCGLERIYGALGDAPRRARTEAACKRLRGGG